MPRRTSLDDSVVLEKEVRNNFVESEPGELVKTPNVELLPHLSRGYLSFGFAAAEVDQVNQEQVNQEQVNQANPKPDHECYREFWLFLCHREYCC